MSTETVDYLCADILDRMVARLPGPIWDSNANPDADGDVPEMYLNTDEDPDAPDEYSGRLYLRIKALVGDGQYTYRVTVERVEDAAQAEREAFAQGAREDAAAWETKIDEE